jgi:hypothetical protein
MSYDIYRCEKPVRTRAICPHHKHLCYGERQDFYDTRRIFFDCGTVADYGYGYYESPKLYKIIKIFKDETGYTAWVPRANWEMLARQVPLEKARGIAKLRLVKGGQIKEE